MKLSKYQTLSSPVDNKHFKRQFFLTEEAIDESLITNVFFVPKVGEEWLYLVKDSGKIDYPGGELREGESVIFGLQRMLNSELGISMKGLNKLGHWILEDKYDEPLRAHFPHPISAAVVFTGSATFNSLDNLKSASSKNVIKLLKEQGRELQADIYLASNDLLIRKNANE